MFSILHDQHVANHVRINGQIWNESPHGGRLVSASLITEVLSLFSPYSILYTIQYLTSGPPGYCHAYSLITAFVSTQDLQKIRLANHIHSVVQLLHADTIQQLELALLGSPAAKLLDVLSISLQHLNDLLPFLFTHQPLHLHHLHLPQFWSQG